MSIRDLVVIVALVELGMHYFPWRMLIGRELPRLAAYTLGLLGMMGPFSVWLTDHHEAEIVHTLCGTYQSTWQAADPPPAVGTFAEMMIDCIVMTYDDAGKPAYKAKGAPYQKHGVRVWDEVLPALGIDPAALKPGPNPITPAIRARVQMNPPTEDGKTAQPRKVTGKA